MLLGRAGGHVAAAAAAVLTLNNLSSSDSDGSPPYSSSGGIRINGLNIQELVGGSSWVSQNSGTEWVDLTGSAGDYEAYLTKTGGGLPSPGPAALDTWISCDTNPSWSVTKTSFGLASWSGTLTIREKADTGNSVSASVSIVLENGFA